MEGEIGMWNKDYLIWKSKSYTQIIILLQEGNKNIHETYVSNHNCS